jgi:hypothetical protein
MSRRRAACGQAMAEFVVSLGVLSILLLGLPALQRYHQLQFAGIGTARELAWLGSADPAGDGSGGNGGNAAATELDVFRAQWLPGGSGHVDARLADVAGLEPVLSRGGLPGVAGEATQALLLPFRPLQALGAGFDLDANGLRSAQLTLHVQSPSSLPEPFNGLALDLTERHVVLADGWGAGGVAQAASRAGGLVPTSVLAPARPLLRVGTLLLSVLEPDLRKLCLGLVDPEVVPADRLVNGGNGSDGAPVTAWVRPC